jgi:hypothetical protein
MVTNKKGQIGNLTGLITVLVVVGILLGVGFLILEQFKSDLSDTTVTVTNEATRAVVTSTGVYMAYNSTTSGINCYNDFAVTSVVNNTGALTIAPGNYTYNTDGKVWSITSGAHNNTVWNVSYTYQKGAEGCVGVESTLTGVKKIPTFLPILVIIAIVGILLAIVFGALKFTDRGTVAQV